MRRMSSTVRIPPPTVYHGFTIIRTGGDIQKRDLIRALFVVALGYFHRVTGITNIHELHTLDHAAVIHVETRNNTFG